MLKTILLREKISVLIPLLKTSKSNPLNYIFFVAIGIIYFIAFLSLGSQLEGLYGNEGILPIKNYMSFIKENYGYIVAKVPTLFWLSSTDIALKVTCYLGLLAALLMIIGVCPLPMGIVCYVVYLSFVTVGDVFLSFQWDNLLLEVGFITIFLAPLKWRWRHSDEVKVSIWVNLAFRILLWRLMVTSGIVKLVSNDLTWKQLTALNY